MTKNISEAIFLTDNINYGKHMKNNIFFKSLVTIGIFLINITFSTIVYSDNSNANNANTSVSALNNNLSQLLADAGFTGKIESTLSTKLGRPINTKLANIGQSLFFDSILSLANDNSCSGCHSPLTGFGDTQSISIGVENNGIVGAGRKGPRNQRRSLKVLNSAFYPSLMWNSRFTSISHNPFDVSEGVRVPFFLGGTTVWKPNAPSIYGTSFDNQITTSLLAVHGSLPPTELIEVAGFAVDDPANLDDRLYSPTHLTSSGLTSDTVPTAIAGPNGSDIDSTDRSYAIRAKILDRMNSNANYVGLFSSIFPSASNGNITFAQIAAAIAEFEFTLTFADAPIDQFARGNVNALTTSQKRGAVLFFGKANCVACHSTAGESQEMFSDFQTHAVGIPQIAPASFGLKSGGDPQNPNDFQGDYEFSGPNKDEDYGREELTGDPVDRYAFRTAPLRNISVQPTFFHNGAFTNLSDALKYHLNTLSAAAKYDPATAGLASDLTVRTGPIEPVLKRLDSRIVAMGNLNLSSQEFNDLYNFLNGGLLDNGALPNNLTSLIPKTLPSGRKVLNFQ